MLERRRERTWTRSGSPRPPRRRAVSRRYSRRRILRALVNAHSLWEAVHRLDCAPSTLSRNTDPRVREAVRRFRRTPAPDWWPGDKHQIATRYGLGESLRRIAGSYGCAPRHIRDVLREADNQFATPTPRPKPCPGRRINPSTGQREFCGVMLPAGRVKRCPACRLQAQLERRIQLRLARWQARSASDRGTFALL